MRSSACRSGESAWPSSTIDRSWIPASRSRLAWSSGAARTSSSSCLTIEPMRITLAGSDTISVGPSCSAPPPVRRRPDELDVLDVLGGSACCCAAFAGVGRIAGPGIGRVVGVVELVEFIGFL